MFRILAAAFAFSGLIATPVLSQGPPPQLIEAAEAAFALCADRGGEANILPGYRTGTDLNGDGAGDFITDLTQMECVGAWGAFCHSTGCPVTLWLSAPGEDYDRFDLGNLRDFSISAPDTGLPVLTATYDEALCRDQGFTTASCTRTWTFGSNTPETPDYDLTTLAEPTPTPTPATDTGPTNPRPEAQPAGWTLRQVPGGSPLALASGTGNIASVSAFCLQAEPFMAIRFTAPPPPGTVSLEFAFSSNAMKLNATHEATAGGAFVMDLTEQPLASALAGRDSSVDVSVDGTSEGTLSLRGSTKALRTALAECYKF